VAALIKARGFTKSAASKFGSMLKKPGSIMTILSSPTKEHTSPPKLPVLVHAVRLEHVHVASKLVDFELAPAGIDCAHLPGLLFVKARCNVRACWRLCTKRKRDYDEQRQHDERVCEWTVASSKRWLGFGVRPPTRAPASRLTSTE